MVKTVVITGASSGIGYALAEAYLAKGYNVVGNARTSARLEEAAKKLGNSPKFIGVAGEIGHPETAKRIFSTASQHFGLVDILINNAGVFIPKPFIDTTTDDLNQLVETNLKGFVYTTQEAVKHMLQMQAGHIISITASIAIQPISSVPATVPILIKGGIDHATRALSLELAPHNIKVNSVAPGIIETPLHANNPKDFLKTLQPVGYYGQPQDIVDAVMYLTESNFVTGVNLPVDGGSTAGKW